MAQITKSMKAGCVVRLKEWLKDGDTLWFIWRGTSASGMQRRYSVHQIAPDAGMLSGLATGNMTFNIAVACGYGYDEKNGLNQLKVNGCGFSVPQNVTDTVAQLLGIKLRYETL